MIKKLLLSSLSATLLFSTLNAAGVNPIKAMLNTNEKVFVVERENSSLAIIEKGMTKAHLSGVHNMNHGVVKFDGKDGYVISRDGWVVKFDPEKEVVLKELKTSDSAIGFTVTKNFLAVANYAKKSVDILDRDLNPLQLKYCLPLKPYRTVDCDCRGFVGIRRYVETQYAARDRASCYNSLRQSWTGLRHGLWHDASGLQD